MTKAAKGGRGYYFRNLLTAEVPREIQRSFADVMKRQLTRSEEFDLGMLCKESYIFTNDFSTKLYDDEERFRRDEDFENTVEHAIFKASNIFAEPSTINWSSIMLMMIGVNTSFQKFLSTKPDSENCQMRSRKMMKEKEF